MSGETIAIERFLALVEHVRGEAADLTAIQAGLLVAARFGIAHDSRTFARLLDLAHALVLREVNALAEQGDLLRIDKRDGRTMRTHFTQGAEAERLFASLPAAIAS